MIRLIVFTTLVVAVYGGALSRYEGRIVGGVDTTIEKHPYQIQLELEGSFYCGGSIISKNYILTAAHCVRYDGEHPYGIRAGSAIRGQEGKLYSIRRIVPHPEYNYMTYNYDFALIQIAGEFDLGTSQKIISLPEQDAGVVAGTNSVTCGWGSLSEGGVSPNILQEVPLPIVDQKACVAAYQDFWKVTDEMICAGKSQGGVGVCSGDSGGPLVVGNTLVGVVSWGGGCALPNFPGVFARVASVRNWIRENSGV